MSARTDKLDLASFEGHTPEIDAMYAEPAQRGFSTWTYSDGKRIVIGPFASRHNVEAYAIKREYRIVWVS